MQTIKSARYAASWAAQAWLLRFVRAWRYACAARDAESAVRA